ncbi:MAG: DUF296 domain-containing protein [Oscillospiraceae bacterium]|jgi:predicted DNA-binding protein with PD1-like motif|nr:DUF296 domain-containing protein [Oscillospiraceae bacterium]
MHSTKRGDTYVVRLEIGEDVVESLLALAAREGIGAAEITGLGASKYAQVGVLDPATGQYQSAQSSSFLEVVSLVGNLSVKDAAPYLHLHALLADPVTHEVLAGHLNALTVGATAEIFVRTLPGSLERRVCDVTGLNILDI